MSKYTILSEREAMESFDQALDDSNPAYSLGYMSFLPSDILKSCDPVAYREDFLCYINNMAEDEVFFVEGYTDEDLEEETEATEE
jgi:hypothetical protein